MNTACSAENTIYNYDQHKRFEWQNVLVVCSEDIRGIQEVMGSAPVYSVLLSFSKPKMKKGKKKKWEEEGKEKNEVNRTQYSW